MYLTSISSRLLLYDVNTWDLKKCYGSYENIIRDINWSDDGKYLLQVIHYCILWKIFVEIYSLIRTYHTCQYMYNVYIKECQD